MRVVLSSCPPGDADRLAAALVQARVAACVTILPGALSRYHWQGEVVTEAESLLLCKVPAVGVDALTAELQRLHPYSVPEILVLAAESALEAYAAWALAETKQPASSLG